MYKIKSIVLILSAVLLAQLTTSQNNTNSPYTRFGFGDISDTNNGEQRAMGGVSIGTRINNSINTVNPASYSCVDSMTFMFDLGVSGLMSNFSDAPTRKVTKANGNLEYLSLQFPITKWLGFSAGALPYSFAGYNFHNSGSTPQYDSSTDTIQFTRNYHGDGGFSQIYMGLSTKLFNHIALGVNTYYMFGTINNYRDLVFSSTSGIPTTSESNSLKANSFRFRFGAQVFNTFAKKHDITLGFIYEQKANLDGNFVTSTTGVSGDTLAPVYGFETPTIYGLGLYYTYDKKLSIGIDYSMQEWKDVQFKGVTGELNNRSKWAIGVDYIPNPSGRKYSDHIHYRAGFNTSDSYYKSVNGIILPKNYGLSVGIGLPLKNSSTVLNATLEYGKIGNISLLNEDYYKLTFNFTFNEHWFFKRKL